jgi:ankyrin repeat protein
MTQEEQFSNIWNTKDLSKQIEMADRYLSVYPDIDCLIGKDSFFKNSLLHLACHVDNLNLVKFLLERKANVNNVYSGRNPLHAVLTNGNEQNNQFEIIKLLTKSGVNIRQRIEYGYRQSCFLLALQCCNLAIVEYLDKNYPESCSESIEFVSSGLHSASGNQADFKVLTYCLELDQEVNKVDENGNTPILDTHGEKGKIEQLLKFGADINFQNPFGLTVLHVSVGTEIETSINCVGELDISNTEYLLVNGADKTRMNEDGFTALDIATRGYGGEYLTKIYTELFAKY